MTEHFTPPSIVAIDGPAASGKTTLGRNLARKLGYLFFDTGVMYRAVTWMVLLRGINEEDEEKVRKILRNQEQAQKLYQALSARFFVGSTLLNATAKNHDDIIKPVELDLSMDISPSIQPQNNNWRISLPYLFALGQTAILEKRQNSIQKCLEQKS